MNETTNGREHLKGEAELYEELAESLKRSRTAAAVQEVEKVLATAGLTVRQKLERIREIDAKGSLGSELWRLRGENVIRRGSLDDAAVEKELAARGLISAAVVRGRKRSLVMSLRRGGLLRMLLRDRIRLARFAAETGAIEFRLFPPRLAMSRRVERYYHETLRKLALSLIDPLSHVAGHGWLWLSPFEYNLIGEFRGLCEKIADLSQEANRTGERDPFVKFRRLEQPFLVCHFRPEYAERIGHCIDLVLSSSQERRYQGKAVRDQAARLLALDRGGLSLYGILQGLAIVGARRWVPLDALVNRTLPGVVNNCTYECSKEVSRSIETCIAQKIGELRRLRAAVQESSRYRAFLEFRQDGSVSTAILQRLLQLEGAGDETLVDGRDMASFTAVFAEAFGRCAESLVGREVTVQGCGTVTLFDSGCFAEILDELRQIGDRVGRLAQVNSHIKVTQSALSGYLAGTSGHAGVSRSEQETTQEIERYVGKLFSCGERLAAVLAGLHEESNAGQPVQPGDIASGRVVLPWAGEILATGQYLRHRSVREATYMLTQVAYLGAWFLCERRIRTLVEGEAQAGEEARNVTALLERIMHPIRFEQLLHEGPD